MRQPRNHLTQEAVEELRMLELVKGPMEVNYWLRDLILK
jgi:hypothetical protein